MDIEKHPFQPFLPENARILFLGSFPPQPHRWCMPFYYPNWINDFWRMPSTSRAYPLKLEKKAEAYRQLFTNNSKE